MGVLSSQSAVRKVFGLGSATIRDVRIALQYIKTVTHPTCSHAQGAAPEDGYTVRDA